MKRLASSLLGLALFTAGVDAENLQIQESHPEHYTVKKGDTLWEISNMFLRNPWMWPEIWQVNQQVANPHLIYPGDELSLIYIEGEPRLSVKRFVKLSPYKRIGPVGDAINAIPLNEIAHFLSNSRVVKAGELEAAPYVLAGAEQRLVVGAGDNLYARGDFSKASNNIFGVYRANGVYSDPTTGEVLGFAAKDVGSVKFKAIDNDIATFAVTRTTQEIRIEDRLLPQEEREIVSTFYPSAPKDDVNGLIIAVEDGVSRIGTLDVVVLNQGLRDGLDVGNVLAIYQRGGVVKDRVRGEPVQLPDERAGLLMVFRSYEKMSFGIVLDATRTIALNDKVRNP